MNDAVLPNVRETRDLGVIVDSKLCFSAHLAQISAKAHQRAGLILRCFKSRDPHLLFRAFCVYVRPILEYCSPVWSPVYKADVTKLEAVQRRFTRRLKHCAGFSYAARLKFLNAETLELRRLKQDLVTIYKMFHGLMDVRVNEFFQVQTANITRGHNYKIIKPVCNNNARQFSFSCRRINCWNSLTQTTVNAHTVAAFKHYLNSVNFNKYLYVLN